MDHIEYVMQQYGVDKFNYLPRPERRSIHKLITALIEEEQLKAVFGEPDFIYGTPSVMSQPIGEVVQNEHNTPEEVSIQIPLPNWFTTNKYHEYPEPNEDNALDNFTYFEGSKTKKDKRDYPANKHYKYQGNENPCGEQPKPSVEQDTAAKYLNKRKEQKKEDKKDKDDTFKW